jgi:amidohydrolase
MNIKEEIKRLTEESFDEILQIRRYIHQHPELSFQEFNTSKYITSVLSKYNVDYETGWAQTGILAHIKGIDSSKKVVLRADMDALPIQEENQVTYKSQNDGVMHACGHDVHTACVLGAIIVLNKLRAHLKNEIYFIFQPGEEKLPGGASLMIEEGIFDNINPDLIIGQHVHPPLASGKVGIKGGMYMASADEIYIIVNGKGGHAALPHECTDTILLASELVLGLQKVVSRKANPTTPSVLTIGKINSIGGATNVIPNTVKLEGTFRTMDEDWRKEAHEIIQKYCSGLAHAFGGEIAVEIKKGYPFLHNDERLSQQVKELMTEFLGDSNVVDLPIRMTAEDFSYFSQIMPSCFYRLGVRNEEKGITSPVHTPTFDIDEEALKTGVSTMVFLAFSL